MTKDYPYIDKKGRSGVMAVPEGAASVAVSYAGFQHIFCQHEFILKTETGVERLLIYIDNDFMLKDKKKDKRLPLLIKKCWEHFRVYIEVIND